MATPLTIAALEIGTSRTVLCVGEVEKRGGPVRILGYSACGSDGVCKGQIVDTNMARMGVRNALKALSAQLADEVEEINQTLLALTGRHIQAEHGEGKLAIQGRVEAENVAEVKKRAATNIVITHDRQVMHSFTQAYTLYDHPDGPPVVVRPSDRTSIGLEDRPGDTPSAETPVGMSCNMMTLDKLAIHALKDPINTAERVAEEENLTVMDAAFAGLCAAMSVLTPEQKRNGVVLIDLGGGTTSYIAFAKKTVLTAGCIAIGGEHVTRDVDRAFGLSNRSRAEKLKCEEGSAVLSPADIKSRITLPRERVTDWDDTIISRHALNTVINARLDELFRELLLPRLKDAGVLQDFGPGAEVVLTGGGANLRKICDLAQRVFGLPCKVGLPQNVLWPEGSEPSPALATIAGLVKYGCDTSENTGFFKTWPKLKKGAK